jgi:type IV pilus assembly protein PilC
MPNYSYTAKGINGELKSGVMDVENESILASTLMNEGYFLITTGFEKNHIKKNHTINLNLFSRKVSLSARLMLTRNLKFMVAAGLSLPRAFTVLAKQTKNQKLNESLIEISNQITKGEKLSEAMSGYPNIFPEFFCSMIKVGEESGTLEEVLENLKKQLEKEYELKSKIKSALIYPIFLVSVAGLLGTGMIIFVVPKFANVFELMNIKVPLMTQIVLNIGKFLAGYWYLIIIGLILSIFLIRFVLKTPTGKSFWDKWVLKIPVVGKVVQKSCLASVARVLGSLISSSVPVAKSLEIVSRTVPNTSYKKTLARAAEDVRKGLNFSESLSRSGKNYPDFFIQIVQVGEETGQTSTILGELADFFEKEVVDAAQDLASVIEPVLILLIGAGVAFLAVSVLAPLYSSLGRF